MPQQWEQGSAARQPACEEASNPYQPIDYAARLSHTPRRRAQNANYQPGQLYAPPVYSAPPAAAPQSEAPAYMQPQSYDVPQLTPGTPYGMNAYQNGPQPFGQQPQWEAAQPQWEGAQPQWEGAQPQWEAAQPQWQWEEAQQLQWAEPLPQWEGAQPQQETAQPAPEEEFPVDETGLKDPFTPAEESKNPVEPAQPRKVQRPPVRVDRVIFLTLAVAMVLFCAIAGGRMIAQLVHSERSFEQARNEYREQTGTELQHGAARVDLLPNGQTFAPTATPTPTVFVATPKPAPIIPINEPAVAGSAVLAAAADVQVTQAPARTRLSIYPKNPLCNVQESLQNLIAENADVVGHLVIPGVLDEVVVQRNNTHYLSRSYTGLPREGGSVFVDESCSFRMPPENLHLRGQASVPGRSFAPLYQYVTGGTAFVSTAATATLTTLYEQEQYVLFAVINASNSAGDPGYFNYASHPTFATDEAMMNYVSTARSRSLYPFNVEVAPSDRLLTLSTLGGDSAVVLIYRMARDGEYY